MADKERFDWITLFWENKGRYDYEGRLETFKAALDHWRTGDEFHFDGDYDYYLSASKMGRQTFHKLEVWGDLANELSKYLSFRDWRNVTRADWRQELSARSTADMKLFVLGVMRRGVAKVNLYPMDTRPRAKNNKRDIGGQGVFLGSRKSDKTLAIYKRGSEMPACEYRLSGPELEALMGDIMDTCQGGERNGLAVRAKLAACMTMLQTSRLLELTGFGDAERYIDDVVRDEAECAEIIAAVRAMKNIGSGQGSFWQVMAQHFADKPLPIKVTVCQGCGAPAGPDGGPCADCDPNPIIP